MAARSERLVEDELSRSYLLGLSAEDNLRIAQRLRGEVSASLPTERQRELAEESAQRFEQRARLRGDY